MELAIHSFALHWFVIYYEAFCRQQISPSYESNRVICCKMYLIFYLVRLHCDFEFLFKHLFIACSKSSCEKIGKLMFAKNLNAIFWPRTDIKNIKQAYTSSTVHTIKYYNITTHTQKWYFSSAFSSFAYGSMDMNIHYLKVTNVPCLFAI